MYVRAMLPTMPANPGGVLRHTVMRHLPVLVEEGATWTIVSKRDVPAMSVWYRTV